MRAIDTNVLLRLLVRDDPRQAQKAQEFVGRGAWLSHLVLAETLWALDALYERSAEQIASAVELLLVHGELVVQDEDVVRASLGTFRANARLGFSDCLLVEIARKAGHLPIGTFDKRLARIDGVEAV